MKPLQTTDSILAVPLDETTLKLSIEGYLTQVQVQPLTDLMIEIIIFQRSERALFADIEMPAYYLN